MLETLPPKPNDAAGLGAADASAHRHGRGGKTGVRTPRGVRLWRRWRQDRASAAVEFALIAPILTGVLLGIADLGLGLHYKMAVVQAAGAGATYAALNGWNSASIGNAVTNATGVGNITASPAPTQTCGCPNSGGTAITTATCGSTCTNGQAAGHYCTVTAQYVYHMILSYPGVSNPMTLTASATARYQ